MMYPALIAINRTVPATLHGGAVPGAAEAPVHVPDTSPKGCSDSLHLPHPGLVIALTIALTS